MRLAFALVAFVVAAGPAMAASKPSDLLHEWELANEACRDGAEGAALDAACSLREIISHKIESAGWCYGRPGEDSAHQNWHACTR